MIKRLFAIGFIFGCVSVAWLVLSTTTSSRTYQADSSLKQRVAQLWGAPQVQQPPSVVHRYKVMRREEVTENGQKIMRMVEHTESDPLALESSDIQVELNLDPRQKGLLWYATYGVRFSATYVVTNHAAVARNIDISLPFPAQRAVFDDLKFDLEGAQWQAPPVPRDNAITGVTHLKPGERATIRVGYKSQGLDRWTYQFSKGVAEVFTPGASLEYIATRVRAILTDRGVDLLGATA